MATAICAVAFAHSYTLPFMGEVEGGSYAPADTSSQRKPRYTVKKTTVETIDDAQRKAVDLRDPENLQTEVAYDEKDNTYTVGTTLKGGTAKSGKRETGSEKRETSKSTSKATSSTGNSSSNSKNATNVTSTGTASGLGYTTSNQTQLGLANSYLSAPLMMTAEEYQQWTMRQSMTKYFRDRNAEAYEANGKSKFDFTDMHFNLGPAEKIFGPGGVQIKTQGLGMNTKKVNNPSLAAN